jgi:predicted  nucleic acid-binding Zn-ribbon protein
MAEVTMEFIGELLVRIQAEQTAMRQDIAEMRAEITVLTHMVFRIERDIVLIKDAIGRLDNRVARLEAERV